MSSTHKGLMLEKLIAQGAICRIKSTYSLTDSVGGEYFYYISLTNVSKWVDK